MKKGFTLAEILITLGIIGVISALTLPALNVKIQKKERLTKFQKTLATINLAYKKSVDENGIPTSAFEMGAENYFKTYWAPYIKTSGICKSAKECGYKTGTPFTQLNGKILPQGIADTKSRISFISSDGVFYVIHTAGYGYTDDGKFAPVNPSNLITIDLNGGKLPNTLGKDVFILTRNNDEITLPCYKESTTKINSDCSPTGSGQCCAEKIVRDGWIISNDYPF